MKTGSAAVLEKNFANHAQFSPDGADIYYAGLRRISVRNLKSGEERDLYRSPYRRMIALALSHDGQYLAFLEQRSDTATVLVTLPVEGGSARDVARFEPALWAEQIEWTPDGKFIFAGNWRVAVESGKAERLDGIDSRVYFTTIHPADDRIAFGLQGPQSTEMWALDNYLP